MNFELSVSSGGFQRSGFNPEPVTDEEEDTDLWRAWRFFLLRLCHHFSLQVYGTSRHRIEIHAA
jgi:hypothetical protein